MQVHKVNEENPEREEKKEIQEMLVHQAQKDQLDQRYVHSFVRCFSLNALEFCRNCYRSLVSIHYYVDDKISIFQFFVVEMSKFKILKINVSQFQSWLINVRWTCCLTDNSTNHRKCPNQCQILICIKITILSKKKLFKSCKSLEICMNLNKSWVL